MEALYVVINNENDFTELLRELEKNGFTGGTILESQGMGYTLLNHAVDGRYGYLRNIFNVGGPFNKTLLMVLEEKRVEEAKQIVREVVGDLEGENIGIMFTVPVTSVEGLTK